MKPICSAWEKTCLPACVRGGWTQLVGVSYERRIYVFRFETAEEQDNALIARMNDSANRSHFDLLFNNCRTLRAVSSINIFPTPSGAASFRTPVCPPPSRSSINLSAMRASILRRNWQSLRFHRFPAIAIRATRTRASPSRSPPPYAVPIALVNPYIAGGIFVDYLVRGRHHLIPKNPQILAADNLGALTAAARVAQNPGSAGVQAPSAVAGGSAEGEGTETANFGLKEIRVPHE